MRRRPDPRPVAVLLGCSGALAVVIALANVIALASAQPVARLRDLRLLARLRLYLDALGVQLLSALPSTVHLPFDLRQRGSVLAFAALAVLVHLALAWIVALLMAPLVLPLARRRAAPGEAWPRSFPAAILAGAAMPVVAHRLGLWTNARAVVIAAATLAIATATWWLLGLGTRTRTAARRLVGLCLVVTLAGATAAAVGAMLTATRSDDEIRVAPPPGAPNVLLVSIDTLRPDHLGSYGYRHDTSPHLDALAAAGARFTTAVSPTSWTLPAHVTLLTALPPEVHGVAYDGRRLDESVVTLAEILRAHGWATAGFVSGPYLDAGYGYARGFEHYDDYSAVRISRPAVHRARTSPALLAIVSRWLDGWDAVAPKRPFFVFLHMWDVHYDFNPPPPYDTLFDPEYRGTVTGNDFQIGSAVHAGMDPRDLAHVVALYDGEIRYTDDHLGRLIDLLRSRGILDETIVVVTADHGEEFFEHGQKGHHNALYDESIRVPLIVRFPPRVPAGTVVERQVRLLDVAPTILALADVSAPPGFGMDPKLGAYAGRSLVPLLAAGADALPAVPAFADLEPHGLVAIRHEDRKLITGPLLAPRDQLFDLRTDPGERIDLSSKDPAQATTLRNEMFFWHTTARGVAKRTSAAMLTEEHKAALRALGYIQ